MRRVSGMKASPTLTLNTASRKTPFRHEPNADDEAEAKRPRRRQKRERMGDAVVRFPAEPEEQQEREGEGRR